MKGDKTFCEYLTEEEEVFNISKLTNQGFPIKKAQRRNNQLKDHLEKMEKKLKYNNERRNSSKKLII